MDGYQFVSSLIGSLAWPAAVVWLAYLLKGPLAKLIPRVRAVKYGELQVDIGEQLEEVKEQVAAAGGQDVAEVEDRSVAFRAIAEVDPRAAILVAWMPVEVELSKIAAKGGVVLRPGKSARELLAPLEEQGLLNHHLIDTIAKLRRIRNQAANVFDRSVSVEDAMSMEEMCSLLAAQLKIINRDT